jgi:hypothetical protein
MSHARITCVMSFMLRFVRGASRGERGGGGAVTKGFLGAWEAETPWCAHVAEVSLLENSQNIDMLFAHFEPLSIRSYIKVSALRLAFVAHQFMLTSSSLLSSLSPRLLSFPSLPCSFSTLTPSSYFTSSNNLPYPG